MPRKVTQYFHIILIFKAITCTIRCYCLKIHMRMRFFNIVNLKGKVISLIYDQTKIFIVKVLRRDLSTTGIRSDRDLRFFDNTNCITKACDFTKIIVIGNTFSYRTFTKSYLYLFRINNRAKIAIRQIVIPCRTLKSHNIFPFLVTSEQQGSQV